jgi:hypothetical protein
VIWKPSEVEVSEEKQVLEQSTLLRCYSTLSVRPPKRSCAYYISQFVIFTMCPFWLMFFKLFRLRYPAVLAPLTFGRAPILISVKELVTLFWDCAFDVSQKFIANLEIGRPAFGPPDFTTVGLSHLDRTATLILNLV